MSIISGTKSDGTHTTVLVGSDGALATSLATQIAGEDLDRGLMKVAEECEYAVVSADTTVPLITGPGRFYGFLCTASSSGVISFCDNTSKSAPYIMQDVSVAAGQVFLPAAAIRLTGGLYMELESGTATLTVLYKAD